jgi:predicted dehydrogenase
MIGRTQGIPVPGTEGFLIDEAAWDDHDVLEAEHAAFIAACLDGAPVLVDAQAGRRALEAALAVTRSMAQSRARAEASGLIPRG